MTDYEYDKIINKNHVDTPRCLVQQIYDLIDIGSYRSIWFPFDYYDSEFKILADELKLTYKATHLFDSLRSDFFTTEPPNDCDLLISNPPFNKQNEIINRVFNLYEERKIKSFVLLLPLSTLETPYRANLFQKYVDNLSIIIFKKRIKFKGNITSFNTACCWVCFNIDAIKNKLNWID